MRSPPSTEQITVAMKHSQVAADSDFYKQVHELFEAEKARAGFSTAASENSRRSRRNAFECYQLLAPYRQPRLPSQAEFRAVLCQDLSPGGFSFLVPERVDFDELIVALGQVPFKFFTARVLNQSAVRRRSTTAYRVGCQFTGRIPANEPATS